MQTLTRVHNDLFHPGPNFSRGKPKWIEAIWYILKCSIFLSPLPWPSGFKTLILRLFGAKLGQNIYFKPRINIHFPWKLEIGDFAMIGEEVCIMNFEPVTIGQHACISQRVFICAGNHDYTDPTFTYRNAPIVIKDGVWVAAQAFVGPGVTIGTDAVVLAGSIVVTSLPSGMVCAGNPCKPIKERWKTP